MEKRTNFEVEIKSKDMIKPLSPTSNHHKNLQLCIIDQISPFSHTPFLFFYQLSHTGNIANSETTILLKESLSEILVQFYPLAGRVEGNVSINCNDEGVVFYKANVSASLLQVTEDENNYEELTRLLPFPPLSKFKSIVAAVQVNHFSCGGIAICVCISHKIADGSTIGAFVNAWANTARGVSETCNNAPKVIFDSASLFRQIDLNGIVDSDTGICKEKILTRRLIFNKQKLDALKKLCADGRRESQEKPTTRVEAVSAFFWKLFIENAWVKENSPVLFCASQAVNLRTINSSPIPETWCGNLFWCAYAYAQVEAEAKYSELASKMRTAVKQIDTSYFEKIKTGEYLAELQKDYENFNEWKENICYFSSLIRFPLYEVNFGGGEPI